MKHPFKRNFAWITLAVLLCTLMGCGDSSENSAAVPSDNAAYKPADEHVADASLAQQFIENDPMRDQVKGQTIYWLSYYDLNPINNQDRSVALQLFEDLYGGKIEYISCTSDNFYDVLASRILAGDPVDMVAYEWDAVPNGVSKNQYQPLDDYIDLSDPLWDDMRSAIDAYTYKDAHYVVPYRISDPLLITYSRSLCQENGLDDPYTLYQQNQWDWNTFLDMMTKFTGNAAAGETRYGVNGWIGQAMLISAGDTVIRYDGKQFINNINSKQIETAETVMEKIASQKLYDPGWSSYFPENRQTLFYAMADWTLYESNVKNVPEPVVEANGTVAANDLMIVPFPKNPDSDTYYLSSNFGAKMLVSHSDKGAAVGAYIKCERLAETIEAYQQTEKEKKLIMEKSAAGVLKRYITEEQYDALMTYRNPANITPLFDFGYGMGSRMFSDGDYSYDTRGIMDNIGLAIINGEQDEWAVVRDEMSPLIDNVLKDYNP